MCIRDSDWTTPVALTPYQPDGGAWHPDLVATDDGLRLVWEDYRDGNAEIYTMNSTNGGEICAGEQRGRGAEERASLPRSLAPALLCSEWGAATRLTEAEGYSVLPQAAVFGQTAYFVWQDNRSSEWEVYFTKDRFRVYLPAVTSSLGKE